MLLATVCAELTFTAVAVPFAWLLLPLLLVMYGAGVLLVREAAVRCGVGVPGLVLLGVAYQLAEDGLGLQALTSPNIYGAADWGWRALGVNWSYWGSQIGVHVVLSVLLPVMLTDLLFPAQRGRPYVRTGGLVGVGALAVLGVAGLRLIISGTEDPGYLTPWGWVVAYLVGIAALAWVALGVLPRWTRRRPLPVVPGAAAVPRPTVPRPAVVGAVTGGATLVFLALLLPPGLRPESLWEGVGPLQVPFAAAVLVGLGSGWLVLRWTGAEDGGEQAWGDRHRVWLAGGVLVAHTLFMMPASPTAAVTGGVVVVLEVVLLVLLARRLRHRQAQATRPVR